jgi:hypothetical protein
MQTAKDRALRWVEDQEALLATMEEEIRGMVRQFDGSLPIGVTLSVKERSAASKVKKAFSAISDCRGVMMLIASDLEGKDEEDESFREKQDSAPTEPLPFGDGEEGGESGEGGEGVDLEGG